MHANNNYCTDDNLQLQPNAWAYQRAAPSSKSNKTFITWVIKILPGNGAPKATNLRLATRMSLPTATICSALTAAVYQSTLGS